MVNSVLDMSRYVGKTVLSIDGVSEMSVVVVRYINEATEQSFILAQDADGDANTLHDAFEEYLVDGWITEILAYHRSADDLDYEDWLQLERREEEAHKEQVRWG